jgi:ubiquinone biosynthesis monooxygenase Coq7
MPPWLVAELRSDHAGETGAVYIYRGILTTSRHAEVIRFAKSHLKTEERHLALITRELAKDQGSTLLPLWKLAGFLTGAIPAVCSKNAVYATIEAVETFVDGHYKQQIDKLGEMQAFLHLRTLLEQCREDEIAHRDEARRAVRNRSLMLRFWCWLIQVGSRGAVNLAKWV